MSSGYLSSHTACWKLILSCASGIQNSGLMKSASVFRDGVASLQLWVRTLQHTPNTKKALLYGGEVTGDPDHSVAIAGVRQAGYKATKVEGRTQLKEPHNQA